MRTRIVNGALVVLLLAAVRPAYAADKEQRQMMADIRMLQEQTQQLQTLLANLTETLKAVNTRIDTRFEEQTNATRKALADEKLVIDNIAHDVSIVREKADDNTVRIGSLTQEVNALRQAVQQAALPRPAPANPLDPTAAPPADAAANLPPPPAAAVLGASPEKAWEAAYADYISAQYDLAVLGFEAYIKSFPTSVRAGEAQVNVCKSYISQGKYNEAAGACDLAIRTYPSSAATPEAYYYKGLALGSLKRLDEARQAYEAVIQKYPESAAATLANQKLQDIKRP